MSSYKATIGLEIHAELNTQTKMFCNSKNDPDETRPNVNVCPVCMGHPGTLPVVNKEAVKAVLKVGVAVGGRLAEKTEFDRKNYFYPDIPKGYQISQYEHPLVSGGSLNDIAITRIHLEEDTGTSQHSHGKSLVNFNRAGVPLMELVTEPVIHSAKQAADFARELQLLLQYLGVSEANMEKGEMRVEANISISRTEKLGTKVEVKNLNSFKAVEKAVAFEVARHQELLESGGEVAQETRGWNEDTEETFSQRTKENSKDYRYFPDPDIPRFDLSKIPEFQIDVLKKEIGMLPKEKREHYIQILAIKSEDAEMYVRSPIWGHFFDSVVSQIGEREKEKIQLASNYISSDLAGLAKNNTSDQIKMALEKITVRHFADLIHMVFAKKVSSRGAKDILKIMYAEGGNPESIAQSKNLFQQTDEATLNKVVQNIIEKNPAVVAQYKTGKTSLLQFLIGQAMKETRGSGNPELFKELFLKNLS